MAKSKSPSPINDSSWIEFHNENEMWVQTSLFRAAATRPLNNLDNYLHNYVSNAKRLMLEIMMLGAAAALLMVHSKGKVRALHQCFTRTSAEGEASSIIGVAGASKKTQFKEVLGIHATKDP